MHLPVHDWLVDGFNLSQHAEEDEEKRRRSQSEAKLGDRIDGPTSLDDHHTYLYLPQASSII